MTTGTAEGTLEAIHNFLGTVATATTLDQIFQASLTCLTTSLQVERSSILLLDDLGVMRFRASTGLSPEYQEVVEGRHSPWAPDAEDPATVLVPDITRDESVGSLRPTLEREGVGAVAFVPLTAAGRLIGKFVLYHRAAHDFSRAELLTAEVLGRQIGLAIDKFRSHEALARSESRYRSLVDGMGVAAYMTDHTGRITFFNEEAVSLWGRRPEPGERWCGSWELYWPDGRPMSHDECPMATTLREGRPVRNIEIIAARPDGTRTDILPFPTPVHDDHGNLVGAVNILVDITRRKHAEQARMELLEREQQARRTAEGAARVRDEFLSIASHELRNPVAAVSAATQMLRRTRTRGELSEERLESYLEILDTSGRHLAELTEDLLDVSRLQRGELPFRPEAADLAALVWDVLRGGDWGDRHILFEAEPNVDVFVDPNRIRQVIQNLVDNAVKYSPGGEPVEIRLQHEGDGLLLVVKDAGIGLPAETNESIFTPFGRASNAAHSNIPGLGLGLFVSRRIAEQHNGRLWADSAGEAQGTTFSLWLPGHLTEDASAGY